MAPRALAKSAEETPADTLSERAAALIQRDILTGRLPPGSRLGIMDLAEGYGMGATPVREGLSRLVARQLVIALGQRGFRVAPVSEADLRDITCMRVVVEQQALSLSMKLGKDDWEAGIVAALHRMQRYVERTGSKFTEGARGVRCVAQGLSHLAAGGLRLAAAARRAFRSLRSGLSLQAGDDAQVRKRQAVRAGAPRPCRLRAGARPAPRAGDAGDST